MSVKLKKKILRWSIVLLLTATLLCTIKVAWTHRSPKEASEGSLSAVLRSGLNRQMSVSLMPLLSFLDDDDAAADLPASLETALLKQMPLYYYSERIALKTPEVEDTLTKDMLIRQEGIDEDVKNIPESELDYSDSALHIEESMLQALMEENQPHEADSPSPDSAVESTPETAPVFTLPAYPAYTYDWSEGFTYDDLISNFYAVDSTTAVTNKKINLDNLLYRDLTIEKYTDDPRILIYHTHSQEAFADSIPGDPSTTIVGAGERLASILRDQYGFNVLHHTGQYDVESRDYAYSNALPAIEQLLADNPSIEVIIDLHRDGMNEGKKLVMDLQGRPTARFMFFNGLSYTKRTGNIDYLENPYIDENLAFSFQEQVIANEYYPGLARKIYLKAYRYNMHLKPKTTLIELGAQTNTVEEIMNACDPLAHIIATVLSGNI